MPTYTYVCDKCGEDLEVVQSMSDDALKKCPKCKANKLRRTFHPVGIMFKGSGFHRNDYATKKRPPESSESSSSSSSSSSDSKSETKSETKSDAKKESKPDTKKSETKASKD